MLAYVYKLDDAEPMISEKKIDEWIDVYLEHIDQITPEVHVRDEEGYKFKSVDTFQQQFNIDAPDLVANLEEAIEQNNLVAGNMYWPRNMLIVFADEYESETRNALRMLFDSNKNVAKRINETQKVFDHLIQKRNERLGEEANSFIGLRFLSLLLGFRYPDKCNAIKPREWHMYCRYIDDEYKNQQGVSSGEKYLLLEPYIEALRNKIKKIPEIQKIKEQLTRGLEFIDSEFRWMAQDVIYVTAGVIAEKQSGEELQQGGVTTPINVSERLTQLSETKKMEFPLEEYLENFIISNWNNIDFGESLTLYTDDEGAPAQQYPTTEGYMDILAVDKDNNFVVIELKKGRSNQAVVGQILAYIGWVQRNLAGDGQKVRGIIIAADGNKALLDAVSTVSDFVSVKYYRMKFSFETPEEGL